MMLVCAANALPFSIFLFSGYLKSVPREIEEAAVIDGCTPFTAFWRITFAFLQPVTAAVIILNGISIWNNYGQAVFLLQTEQVRTVPLAISLFFQQYGAHWNLVAASAFLAVVPALAVFLGFQNHFIKGITAGAVKG
jgi:raffinose/stachyose/melibiose transport system permease protein